MQRRARVVWAVAYADLHCQRVKYGDPRAAALTATIGTSHEFIFGARCELPWLQKRFGIPQEIITYSGLRTSVPKDAFDVSCVILSL